MGNPVAFEASAEERETRGFISMITRRPVEGSTANCTLEPPVSTPTRRRQAKASSRMAWYSTSVSVCAGATVMESPVCTPIGSKFSMEQTTTQLSAASRITSSSNSFQPAIDFSTRIWPTGLAARPFRRQLAEVRRVLGDARPLAAEDEARPHHDREADVGGDLLRLLQRVGEARAGHLEADLLHGGLEAVPVLGGRDRLGPRPDHLDAVALEDAELDQLHGQVQRRLPAERRQQRVGPLLLDDGRQHLGVERLDVGPVRRGGVRHDRGRVGVGQDHPVALLGQDPAGLGARVVELAGLADHDRARPDDEDRLQVVAARHGWLLDPLARPDAGAGAGRTGGVGQHELAEGAEEVAGVVRARVRPRGGTAPRTPAPSRERKPSITPSLRLTCVVSASGMEPAATA